MVDLRVAIQLYKISWIKPTIFVYINQFDHHTAKYYCKIRVQYTTLIGTNNMCVVTIIDNIPS